MEELFKVKLCPAFKAWTIELYEHVFEDFKVIKNSETYYLQRFLSNQQVWSTCQDLGLKQGQEDSSVLPGWGEQRRCDQSAVENYFLKIIFVDFFNLLQ